MAEKEKLPPKSSPDTTPEPEPTPAKHPESSDSILDFGITASVREGASGVIPLADLPDPTSSPSLVSWTEVIRQHRETAQAPADKPVEPVKIDSTSDKDLLARIADEEQRMPPPLIQAEEHDTDKYGKIPLVGGSAGSSVQLDRGIDDGLPQGRSGSAVRFDLRETPSDAGGAMRSPWVDAMIPEALPIDDADVGEADIPMAEAIPYEPAEDELAFAAEMAGAGASGSGINFGSVSKDDDLMDLRSSDGTGTGQSSILDILVKEDQLQGSGSGRSPSDIVDVTAKPRSDIMEHVDSGNKRAMAEAVELPESTPILELDNSAEEAGSTSKIDLDSSAEEAVDLHAEGPVSRGISDSGTLDISDEEMEEASRRQKLVESSAIDLSSSPTGSLFEVEIAAEAGQEGAVDMSLPESQESGIESSMIQRYELNEIEPTPAPRARKTRDDSSVPAKSRGAAVGNEPSDVFEKSASPPAKSPRGQKADAAPRKKGGLLLGAFLGVLLAGGGIGAAWYLKQLPDPDSVFGDGSAKSDNKGGENKGNDNKGDSAELAKARKDVDDARKAADDAKKAADDARKAADDMAAGFSKQLKDAGIDDPKLEDGLKKALAGKIAAEGRLANATTALQTAEAELKLVVDKVQPKKDQKVGDAIAQLIASKEKAEADHKAAALAVETASKQLKDAGIDDPKLEDGLKKAITAKADAELKVKNAVTVLDKAGAKDPDLTKAIAMLVAAKDGSEANAKAIRERLEKAKIIAANADQAALLKAIDEAITRGSSDAIAKLAAEKKTAEDRATRLSDDLAKTRKESDAIAAKSKLDYETITAKAKQDTEAIAAKAKKDNEVIVKKAKDDLAAQKMMYEAKLTDVRTPAQLIDVWLPALADKDKPANTAAAIADAEIVIKNSASTDADKAKALAVKALALRNQGKLTEARSTFADARKHPGFVKDQAWAKAVASAADTLENPAAFVGAAQTVAAPTMQQLLERVEGGIKLFEGEKFAKDRARLIAQRSLLKLDAADLPGAHADADEAVKAGAGADGYFALARVFETQGKFADAESAYRAVLKAQAQGSSLYKQASLGLARVLLQKGKPAPTAPTTTSMLDADAIRGQLILMVVLFADPTGDIPPDVQEAINLADALIAQKEYHGYIIKADALAKIGRFNAALTAYSTGIKALKVLPREYDGVLDRILAKHPALQRPDVNVEVDPSKGLKHYAQGLEYFRAQQYSRAEVEFTAAVRNWNQDARFLYYLGLSRWNLGKKDIADADFKAGSLLELKGLPLPNVITEALERVQGDSRAVVEAVRP